MYDLTNLTNVTDISGMGYTVNELSGGLMGYFMLFSLFLLSFIIFKKFTDDTKQVFLTSSLFTCLFAVFLFNLGWIGQIPLIFSVVLLFVGIVVYQLSGE